MYSGTRVRSSVSTPSAISTATARTAPPRTRRIVGAARRKRGSESPRRPAITIPSRTTPEPSAYASVTRTASTRDPLGGRDGRDRADHGPGARRVDEPEREPEEEAAADVARRAAPEPEEGTLEDPAEARPEEREPESATTAIAMFRRRSSGRPRADRSAVAASVKAVNETTIPATIAYGRRELPPLPPARTTGRHREDAGRERRHDPGDERDHEEQQHRALVPAERPGPGLAAHPARSPRPHSGLQG